jgi:two-component system, chemotaxis family, chemotaxis protein CheY
MAKKVLLIGHCLPDTSYLRIAISTAVPGAAAVTANSDRDLQTRLTGMDLALVNRELDGDFAETSGVELIKRLRPFYPSVKFMLVSNFPQAQSAAVAAGALPGFGKRDIGSPVAAAALNHALKETP